MTEKRVFVPKPGQVDYTDIRYCPVINCVVMYRERMLIVKRSANLEFYPSTWNGISGFLDDTQDLTAKALEELSEEIGLEQSDVVSMRPGSIFHQHAPDIGKTWIVHPLLVEVRTDAIRLDWEGSEAKWIDPRDLYGHILLPGFGRVVETLIEISSIPRGIILYPSRRSGEDSMVLPNILRELMSWCHMQVNIVDDVDILGGFDSDDLPCIHTDNGVVISGVDPICRYVDDKIRQIQRIPK